MAQHHSEQSLSVWQSKDCVEAYNGVVCLILKNWMFSTHILIWTLLSIVYSRGSFGKSGTATSQYWIFQDSLMEGRDIPCAY